MEETKIETGTGQETGKLFEFLKGRWRLAILRSLSMHSPQRLAELRRSLPGISKKVLLDNLLILQDAGLLARQDLSTKVKWVEYSLSESARLAISKILAAAEDLNTVSFQKLE